MKTGAKSGAWSHWAIGELIRLIAGRPSPFLAASARKIAGPRQAVQIGAERRHAPVQFAVDLLVEIDLINPMRRDAEAGQEADEKKSQPQLKTPANGVGHLHLIRCSNPGPVG
jgi:hypothetical protein